MKKILTAALLAALLAASLLWAYKLCTADLPDWLRLWLLS